MTFNIVRSNWARKFEQSMWKDGVVDKHAFADTVIISIWGKVRHPRVKTIPIGSPKSTYARQLKGVTDDDNPFTLNYGRRRQFKSMPHARLILQSEAGPLTKNEIL